MRRRRIHGDNIVSSHPHLTPMPTITIINTFFVYTLGSTSDGPTV